MAVPSAQAGTLYENRVWESTKPRPEGRLRRRLLPLSSKSEEGLNAKGPSTPPCGSPLSTYMEGPAATEGAARIDGAFRARSADDDGDDDDDGGGGGDDEGCFWFIEEEAVLPCADDGGRR